MTDSIPKVPAQSGGGPDLVKTPRTGDGRPRGYKIDAVRRYLREAEIETWLRDAGREYEPWVALDDDQEIFSPGCWQLILVDASTGFNERTETELRRRLRREAK